MMIWIIAILVILMWFYPSIVICAVRHPFKLLFYTAKDWLDRVLHKKKRLAKTGEIIAFFGYFGRGKTLSAVNMIFAVYRKYHNMRVYCPRRRKWVIQKIHVVTNVHIDGIEYEKLTSLEQVILSTNRIRELDDKNDTLTATYVLIDEAGSELSHREFMKNINPVVLNSILTCRHWNMSLVWTAQSFKLVDKLLRDVTLFGYECLKMWRFMYTRCFTGRDLEKAEDTVNIRPLKTSCWFVSDKDYKIYDTYGSVEKLKKDIEEGNLMTEEELQARGVGFSNVQMDGVEYSKKYKKRHKKLY